MPFDANAAGSITDTFNAAFDEIATTMPFVKRRRPMALIAWEYHWASHLWRRAEARRVKATANAVRAGVLFDHGAMPEPVGTTRLVYEGELVEVALSVAAPICGVDHPAFVADLLAAGVDKRLVSRLQRKHATQTKPAHKFLSFLTASRAAG